MSIFACPCLNYLHQLYVIMHFRINPFVKKYTQGGLIALFNSLTLDTVYFDKTEYEESIEDPPQLLYDNDFLVPCNFDALSYFIKKVPQSNPSIDVAYFLLTSACDFRCKYCFVETRMNKVMDTNMSEEIAIKALKLLKRTVKDNPVSIVLYGGEPLLRFDMIRYVVSCAKQLHLNANYVMVTNGSVMNEEIATFLRDNNFEVGVSLDGDRETNDKMRIDSDGKGTYERVSKTIEQLLLHNITPGISCTLSKHNMDRPIEILNYLKKHKLFCVSFNLPAPNGNITIDDGDRKSLVKNLMRAETELVNEGVLEDKVVDRRLRAFIEKNIWLRDCAAYGQQIVVMPNGKVGVCHGLWPDKENSNDNSFFDIDVNYDGEIAEHPNWKEWRSRTVYNMPQCWNCPAISLCGGGCAKNALIKHNSIWEVDSDICILMQEVVPWVIWTYYDKVNQQLKKGGITK